MQEIKLSEEKLKYSKDNILIVDIESTCWNYLNKKEKHEIFQIGIIDYNFITNKCERANNYYVKIRFSKISSFCTKITGASQKTIDLYGQPYEQIVQDIVNEFDSKNKFWISFGKNDKIMLQKMHELYPHVEPFLLNHIDMVRLYKYIHGNNPLDSNLGLSTMLEKFDLSFIGNKHSAIYDSYNLMRIVKKIRASIPDYIQNYNIISYKDELERIQNKKKRQKKKYYFMNKRRKNKLSVSKN